MNAARSNTAWMPKVRSKLLARLNSRSRSLCRLVDGDDEDCSFLFVNKVDEGAPVNFRIGCGGGKLSLLLLLRISYISDDSFLPIKSRSSESSSLFLEEATVVKDLMCRVGCLI